MDGDRTLLEKATKAAGLHLVWNSECACYMRTDCIGTVPWNPLKNDGDALRLAVKLDMEVRINRVDEFSEVVFGYSVPMSVREIHATDPYAATRRAIVRAAAALSESP